MDGQLDELQSARLERHLLDCAACSAWERDVAGFTTLLHDAEPVTPAWTLEFGSRALRRRGRAVAAAATAASAAAMAAFALGLPGSISLSSGSPQVSAAPCTSCTKKQVVTFAAPVPVAASAPAHVANPFVEQD